MQTFGQSVLGSETKMGDSNTSGILDLKKGAKAKSQKLRELSRRSLALKGIRVVVTKPEIWDQGYKSQHAKNKWGRGGYSVCNSHGCLFGPNRA